MSHIANFCARVRQICAITIAFFCYNIRAPKTNHPQKVLTFNNVLWQNIKMLKSNSIFIILLTFILSGCATSYHALGLSGGYSEIKTSSDSLIVTFRGNGYTRPEKVFEYALKRASELTLQNGYRYFYIMSSVDQTRSLNYSHSQGNASASMNSYRHSNYSSSHLSGTGSSTTFSGTVNKPGISIGIKCFKEKPNQIEVIDAEYYLRSNLE